MAIIQDEFGCLSKSQTKLIDNIVRYKMKMLQKDRTSKHKTTTPKASKQKDSTVKTPILTTSKTFLVENDLWENCIVLSGLKREKSTLEYVSGVRFGGNVNFQEAIDLNSVPGGCLIIMSEVEDWMVGGEFPPGLVHSSLCGTPGVGDYVVVMLAGCDAIKEHRGQKIWDSSFLSKIEQTLNQTVKGDGKTHFRTLGSFMGLGHMAKYNLDDGQCSYGRVKHNKKATELDIHELHEYLDVELECMIDTLNFIIPDVVSKGQVVTQDIVNTSNLIGHKIHPLRGGFITGMVCKDAQTMTSHVEKDCAFTFIGIPFLQNVLLNYVFEFGWGKGRFILLKLLPGTVIYYHAFGIQHRQYCLDNWASSNKNTISGIWLVMPILHSSIRPRQHFHV